MDSHDWIRRDLASVWHPCTQMKDHEILPPIVVREARGVWVTDIEGRRYLDAISSWWVNTLGHNHPRLNEAIGRQLQRFAHVIFAGFTHEKAIETAEELIKLAPSGLRRVFFADSGSSAVEVALKMSYQFWQQSGQPRRRKFLSFEGNYHGETVGALSVGGLDLYRRIYRPLLMEVVTAPGPDCFRCPFGLTRDLCGAECLAPAERLAAEQADEICGTVVEPMVQGAAGMRIAPPVFLQRLRALCDRSHFHLIADEIMTGFGRTGRMWACGHAGVSPDLMCLAKGLTAGYLPMSVTLATEEIYQAFYDDYTKLKTFFHSHSHSGNALACAVAAETLAIYREERIVESLGPKIARLARRLEEFKDHPNVGEIRQLGMIAAIELVRNREKKTPFPFEERTGWQIYRKALEKGAILRPLGDVIYFLPPLIITEDEIDTMIDFALESMREVLGG